MKSLIIIIFLFTCSVSFAQSAKAKKVKMLEWVESIDALLLSHTDSSLTVFNYAGSLGKLKWPSRPGKNKIKHVSELQALVSEYVDVVKMDTAKLKKQIKSPASARSNTGELIVVAAATTSNVIVDAPTLSSPVKSGKIDPLSGNIEKIIADQQKKYDDLMRDIFNKQYEKQKELFVKVQSVLKSMESLSSIFIEATYDVQRNQRAMIQLSLEQEQRVYRLKLFQAIDQVRTDFSRIERKRKPLGSD